MSDVRVWVGGALKPSDFIGALTDFGPGRSAIGGNSSAAQLVVHEVGGHWADVLCSPSATVVSAGPWRWAGVRDARAGATAGGMS
jgi:hypothetical protein